MENIFFVVIFIKVISSSENITEQTFCDNNKLFLYIEIVSTIIDENLALSFYQSHLNHIELIKFQKKVLNAYYIIFFI